MASTSLTEIERLARLLGDAVDQLESCQAIDPSPTLEDATNTVRFVRDRLARSQAAHLGSLAKFVREHPVAEPYDPDDNMERE